MSKKRKLIEKKKAIATVALFSAIFLIFGAVNFFVPDKDFSENENRVLQTFPKFSFASLFSSEEKEKYTNLLDTYVTDQFFARDSWVGIKSALDKAFFKKDSGGVYFAENGYLIEMFDTVDAVNYTANLNFLKKFEDKMAEQGVSCRTMLVPTASCILRDKFSKTAPEVDQKELLSQAEKILSATISVEQNLSEHKNEYIYYRTDHHWTTLGAFYGYQSWCRTMGYTAPSLSDYIQKKLTEDFYGTTFSKVCLKSVKADAITAFYPKEIKEVAVTYDEKITADTMYELSHLENKDKYPVLLDGNHGLTEIRMENGTQKTLLVIKDSYANSIVPFLTRDYDTVYMVDLRYTRENISEFVTKHGVDDVLICYNLKGFSEDKNIVKLAQG